MVSKYIFDKQDRKVASKKNKSKITILYDRVFDVPKSN